MDDLIVDMTLKDGRLGLEGVSADHPDWPLKFDYVPPHGQGQGFMGLEMLVMSFTGCVSTGILAVLRRMGKTVAGYRVRTTGIRREAPLSLASIHLAVTIDSPDATAEDLATAFKGAEKISPVWIAVRNNVEVTTAGEVARPA